MAAVLSGGRRREPAVISVGLITSALEEEGRAAHTQADVDYAAWAAPALEVAPTLRLSFRNLIRAENLGGMHRLRELRLDNNALTRIEGLDELAELRVLDLSFNRIEAIGGLGSQARLTDLSLYANIVTRIEGLDACADLECLSLGANRLADVGQLAYLRRFPRLRLLALEGNPFDGAAAGDVSSSSSASAAAAAGASAAAGAGTAGAAPAGGPDYRTYCHAFLPQLRYLDYALITAADVRAARDGGVSAELLAEVDEAAALDARAREAGAERAATLAALRSANVEATALLAADVTSRDTDLLRLLPLPRVAEAVRVFENACASAGAVLRDSGAAQHERVEELSRGLRNAVAAEAERARGSTVAALDAWNRQQKLVAKGERVVFAAPSRAASGRTGSGRAAGGGRSTGAGGLADAARALGETAMLTEIAAHEAIEVLVEAYDANLADAKQAKLATHDAYFRAVEAHERELHGAVRAATLAAAAAVANAGADVSAGSGRDDASGGGLDLDTLPDDLYALLLDAESLARLVAASHERRADALTGWEAEVRGREEERAATLVAEARAAEEQRNRDAVTEIGAVVRAAVLRAAASE